MVTRTLKPIPSFGLYDVHVFLQCQAWLLISSMSFAFLNLKYDLVLFVTGDAMTEEKTMHKLLYSASYLWALSGLNFHLRCQSSFTVF